MRVGWRNGLWFLAMLLFTGGAGCGEEQLRFGDQYEVAYIVEWVTVAPPDGLTCPLEPPTELVGTELAGEFRWYRDNEAGEQACIWELAGLALDGLSLDTPFGWDRGQFGSVSVRQPEYTPGIDCEVSVSYDIEVDGMMTRADELERVKIRVRHSLRGGTECGQLSAQDLWCQNSVVLDLALAP